MPPKKAAAKAKRTQTKKATAKKATAKKATAKKATVKKTASKATLKTAGRSATPLSRSSSSATGAKRGDRIVIDSVHVGSPAREGEILKVVVGQLSVSYQVKWGDGHESFITPVAGTAHILRT
jgi:hypothetical protein